MTMKKKIFLRLLLSFLMIFSISVNAQIKRVVKKITNANSVQQSTPKLELDSPLTKIEARGYLEKSLSPKQKQKYTIYRTESKDGKLAIQKSYNSKQKSIYEDTNLSDKQKQKKIIALMKKKQIAFINKKKEQMKIAKSNFEKTLTPEQQKLFCIISPGSKNCKSN